MKLLTIIIRCAAFLIASSITGFIAVESWVDAKIDAAENKILEVRKIDMEHLNSRLVSIDTKMDTMIKIISKRK